MKNNNLFECLSFSDFLFQLTQSRGPRGGLKSELAEAMGTHPAYLSRVLGGHAQLSLEQAEKIAAHLQMTDEEKRFLLFLLQEERAGTLALKKFFRDERIKIQERHLNIKDRIPQSKQISKEDQAVYYSAWYYQAIHVLVSIPKFRDLDAIANYLEISIFVAREAIIFLERTGIIKRQDHRWVAGEYHLDRSSPFIRQHHANWRMRSVHSIDSSQSSDIRYSGVFSLSTKDVEVLKNQILRNLNEYLETVKSSNEEKAYVLGLDFFEL